ncbi:MAG TPA: S8 family serine peptidase, partial [Steroidobacteraceae bacterium]|nr:S8 family serine peptidase [Steroidobacteraceae bacterium]
ANDGDGWDPDPSDPGDWINSTDQQNALFPSSDCPVGDSSWHGTRVSGVLGALSNNGVGVAGMTWAGFLLPVRALGKCGGYDSDIISGIQWAVGMSVEGVPDNPYPADIVNLSLGGSGSCPSDYQSVFDSLNAMGVLVVASAGNETGPVDAPANCSGILAVAGLRNVGTKVGYSSFGPEVGISAPAGNCVVTSGDCYRSIDTTTNLGATTPGANSYTSESNPNLGTSFSAPIVSGVAALMRAVNANLTPPQLIARLKASASAFPPNSGSVPVCSSSVTANGASGGECSCVTTECGAGMVDASAAVQAALAPIAAVVVPSSVAAGGNAVFDAGGSAASCGRTIAAYAWAASGGVTIMSGASSAQVTVMPSGTAGTLTLTVTDSSGQTGTAAVSFGSSGATTSAPSSAGTSASACPASLTVTPAAPTVTESFSPASVTENAASTLTITFNDGNAFDLTQAAFTETVPSGLTVESSPAPTTTCSGSGTLANTASSVTMTGAYIPAKGSCSITLSVESATATSYTNTIAAHALSTGPAGSNAAAVSATLTVTAPAKSGGGSLGWLDLSALGGAFLLARGRRPRAGMPRHSGDSRRNA